MRTPSSLTLFLFVILAAVIASMAIPGARSSAGTAISMDLNEVFDASEWVAEVHVHSQQGVLGTDGLVYTDFTVSLDRSFWGDASTVQTLRLPGGVLDSGRATIVPGMSRLRVGEDYFLMLSAPSSSGARMVSGLSQGSFKIRRGADGSTVAVRTSSGGARLQPMTGKLMQGEGQEVIEYADLIARLESAAAARRARLGDKAGEVR